MIEKEKFKVMQSRLRSDAEKIAGVTVLIEMTETSFEKVMHCVSVRDHSGDVGIGVPSLTCECHAGPIIKIAEMQIVHNRSPFSRQAGQLRSGIGGLWKKVSITLAARDRYVAHSACTWSGTPSSECQDKQRHKLCLNHFRRADVNRFQDLTG